MNELPSIIKNFIHIELKPFKKDTYLGKKGINELYKRMYIIADEIAVHETERYSTLQNFKDLYGHVIRMEDMKDSDKLSEDIGKYRNERVEHHMKEMKEILYKILESQKEKKNKS